MNDTEQSCSARILVIGVGGGGNNAVNNMIDAGITSCDYIAANTDKQALFTSRAERRLQLGRQLTKGLGAGSDPEIGEKAAVESEAEIAACLDGVDLLFIAAGMGGGTGTGAAPVIAQIAKQKDILTIAVVTRPFDFEGKKRKSNADMGIEKLRKFVDTLLVIPNQKLLTQHQTRYQYGDGAKKQLSIKEAFKIADDVLRQGIQGITDLIVKPALINLDFADVRTVIKNKGIAHMGIGIGKGERRHIDAASQAVSSALLETRIEGATALILNFTGGEDTTIDEIGEACNLIRDVVDEDANIIFGLAIEPGVRDEIRLTVIATGFVSKDILLLNRNPRYASSVPSLYGQDLLNPPMPPREQQAEPKPHQASAAAPAPVEKSVVSSSRIDVDEDASIPPFLKKLKKK
ncbi:MAG TPA: cell division protein FtsZ [Eubacteriales bacterium]|jgi:cell division protein FtsZ|nr:cell division protein FtsZ [Clostridia bacterium]HRR89545.1 cell division protein FtsZ [Eubacteriales bacterium]HRU84127.1 cell division protein FtsZ [Eubacteriales bacterium]